jgi:hypothetical protein
MPKSKHLRRRSLLTSSYSDPAITSDEDDEPLKHGRSSRSAAFAGLIIFAVAAFCSCDQESTNMFHIHSKGTSHMRKVMHQSHPVGTSTNKTSMSCSHLPPANFIAIRGERHSATNLFRQITNRNGKFQHPCIHHNDLERCEEYLGWKHGFLRPNDVIDNSMVVAVMVRDAFSWLVSMYYEPYNMILAEGTNEFENILQSTYSTASCEPVGYDKDCKFPMEEADNLMKLRTKKYRNWIDFLSPSNETEIPTHRWSIIRQEDLVGQKRQEETVSSFFDKHCIESLRSTFRSVGKIVTNSMQSNQVDQKDILQKFTVNQLQYVLDNLDLDFEKELGYDYSYVNDHIAQRIIGALTYTGPPQLNDKMLSKRMKLIEDNLKGNLPGRDISIEDSLKERYAMKQKVAFQ